MPLERVLKLGGAGDSPAPVGDPPTGTAAAYLVKRLSLARAVAPVASGGSPDGTGGSPVLPTEDFSPAVRPIRHQVLDRLYLAACLLTALAAQPGASAAPVDQSKLPPPATNKVDFLIDIKPILDSHCVKCHGPERPKSRFRVDQRAALLKGGENGVDVIPGRSAQSPLIHYVAGLVSDMQMPPEGKGEPLTALEISLLRAWIDQDLPWSGTEPASRTEVELAPTLRWMTVAGDERKFREHEWFREGWNSGAEHFALREPLDPNSRLTITGHALRDDYQVHLTLEQADGLVFRAGFEKYRKYYDDSGGYYQPFASPLVSLGRDLRLDMGRLWVEAGGTTPVGLQLTAGYEYQFKEGAKSLTQWRPTGPTSDPRNILPNAKEIDEHLHLLRLDGEYDWRFVRFIDQFRYESYNLDTARSIATAGFPPVSSNQRMKEGDDLQNLANAFRTEAQPWDWMLVSAGYLYTHTSGESSFRQSSVDPAGLPATGPLWNGEGITLEQSAHVFNANAQLEPWKGLTFSSGVQTDWNRQRSFGTVHFDETDFFDPSILVLNTNRVMGDYDRFSAEEKFTLRDTQVPFTVFYGEVRLRQEEVQQFEELLPAGAGFATLGDFRRDTDACYDWKQYRVGFNTSPWSRVALSAYAQRRDHDDSFHHGIDERPVGSPGYGYPGFIVGRQTLSDEVGTKLVVRPASWLKTTLAYKVLATDYKTDTDSTPTSIGSDSTPGGRVLAGQYDAHVYSFNATLTPWRRLYFFSTFSFQDSRTITADHGSESIAPFRGHVYSVLTSANYVLNDQTDLNLAYDFSYANYGQNNEASGLPLGIDYRRHGMRAGLARRFWKRCVARLDYVLSYYDEPSGGHFNDYTAHGVFATLLVRWD